MGAAGWLAGGVLGGLVLAQAAGAVPGWWCALALATLCGGSLLRPTVAMRGWALCAGLGLGAATHGLRGAGPVVRGAVTVHGTTVSAPVGGTTDVWAHAIRPAGSSAISGGRVRLELAGRAPPPGTEVVVFGQALGLDTGGLPGSPDLSAGADLAGVRTRVRANIWHAVGRSPRRRLPPGHHGGVLQALAWGDRTHLDPALVQRMRRTGTAHLLAISGFHVGLVAGAVGGLLLLVVRLVAILSPRGLPQRWVWIVGALAGHTYAWLAGAPVGAARAALVVLCLAVLRGLGWTARPVELLLVVAACLAVADPAVLASPGFQLSFGAVLGLVRLMPGLMAQRPRWWPGWLTLVWTSLSASLAATLGTLPAAGWWFQAVSWTGPLGNLLAAPVVSVVLVPLSMAHALGPRWLDPVVGVATDVVVEGLHAALAVVDAPTLPLAVGPLGAAALLCALLVHRRWAWLLAALVLATPGPSRPVHGLRLTWPDIGQGSATLVEFPDGRRWLVDGGASRERVLHWLRRRGVRRLDVVAATVGRVDHAAGLARVVEALPVGEVWIPDGSRHDPELRDLVSMAVARRVPVVPGPASNLAGDQRRSLRDEGDRSLVLHVSWAGTSVLLPGDVGPAGLHALLPSIDGPVDVVMAPRHGSRLGVSAGFVGATQPALVVTQSGRHHRHGHPHPEVVGAWRRAHSRVLRTDLDGTVEVTLLPGVTRVRTWRRDQGWRRRADVRSHAEVWQSAGLHAGAPIRAAQLR